MQILILTLAALFTLTAFLAKLPITPPHSFLGFLLYQADVILNHSFIFSTISILIVFIFLRSVKFEESHSVHKKYALTVIHLATISTISIFTSYLFLLCIAWFQLTSVSLLTHINPRLLNLTTQKKEIITKLKNDDIPPQIVASDDTPFDKLVAISSSLTGTNTFYGSTILPSIPSFLVIPPAKLESVIFVDNTLIIANVDHQELETFSPLVGYMFIKHYFPQRSIRFYPTIIAITDNEYESYRVMDSKEKLKTLETQLQTINETVSSTSASLTKLEAEIKKATELIPQTFTQKNEQMKKCNAEGSYVNGIFKHTNTQLECQEKAVSFDTIIDTANKQIDDDTKKLPIIQAQLTLYKQYQVFFTAQKKANALLDKNIPHELGVFKPPATIRILLNTKSSHALADYFATSVHEYLHYASSTPKKNFTILFFEEGLTEYFTREIIKDNLNISTNLGYPIFAKIIKQMTKAIPESDLEEIYFTKDQTRLEETLNRVYGETFYKDNALLFTTLQYASSQAQILTTANTIMKHIGGSPLTKEDIFSTESNL